MPLIMPELSLVLLALATRLLPRMVLRFLLELSQRPPLALRLSTIAHMLMRMVQTSFLPLILQMDFLLLGRTSYYHSISLTLTAHSQQRFCPVTLR